MSASKKHLLSGAACLALLGMVSLSHADENDSYVSAMRYVSLDTQRDNADSQQFSGTGSFTLGKYVWLQGTLGRINDSNSASLGDLKNYGFGAGLKGEHLQFTADFSHYRSDGSFRQRDVNAALDWHEERFSLGLDLFHRSTDNSIDATRSFPTLGLTNVALHVDENLTGNGFGAHATFDITEQLSLSLGGMGYSYDSDYQLTSSTNPILIRRLLAKHPTLSQLVYLNNSGITRSLALLDNSFHLGLSYQFSAALLSAQYLRDTALDSDVVTNTAMLDASILVGDHWIVAPAIGQSKSDQAERVTFGGLSVSYNW
ncbi:MAG: hypothetical protein AB7T07_11560 [Steroidobacteraceae bacterium]